VHDESPQPSVQRSETLPAPVRDAPPGRSPPRRSDTPQSDNNNIVIYLMHGVSEGPGCLGGTIYLLFSYRGIFYSSGY